MFKKIILPLLVVALLAAGAVYYFVFVYSVKNHRNINKEEAISILADSLIQEFTNNEANANTKYLNKILAIKGVVIDTASNQQGTPTLTVGSANNLSNVFVTLSVPLEHPIKLNDSIRIKGVCSGYLSDVVISEAFVVE